MTRPLEIKIATRPIQARLDRLVRVLADPTPINAGIAVELLSQTEQSFEDEGPGWQKLRPRTIKARDKQGMWPGKILQVTNALARSYVSGYGRDYALVGSNLVYAAIHHHGGDIQREGRAGTVRLRTDAKGALLRQGKNGKLAVFARRSHKRAAERSFEAKAYTIKMPARPALPVDAAGNLTPRALDAIVGVLERALS